MFYSREIWQKCKVFTTFPKKQEYTQWGLPFPCKITLSVVGNTSNMEKFIALLWYILLSFIIWHCSHKIFEDIFFVDLNLNLRRFDADVVQSLIFDPLILSQLNVYVWFEEDGMPSSGV